MHLFFSSSSFVSYAIRQLLITSRSLTRKIRTISLNSTITTHPTDHHDNLPLAMTTVTALGLRPLFPPGSSLLATEPLSIQNKVKAYNDIYKDKAGTDHSCLNYHVITRGKLAILADPFKSVPATTVTTGKWQAKRKMTVEYRREDGQEASQASNEGRNGGAAHDEAITARPSKKQKLSLMAQEKRQRAEEDDDGQEGRQQELPMVQVTKRQKVVDSPRDKRKFAEEDNGSEESQQEGSSTVQPAKKVRFTVTSGNEDRRPEKEGDMEKTSDVARNEVTPQATRQQNNTAPANDEVRQRTVRRKRLASRLAEQSEAVATVSLVSWPHISRHYFSY